MEKQTADKYIFRYRDKIFGFALEKTRNIDRAQELASDIVYEVYRAFLKKDDIANLDGYVYRISRNVWARYAARLADGRRFTSIDGMNIAAETESEDDGMAQLLRREIGYLSDRQRRVIWLHYYKNMAVADIAVSLGISQGTVKWHLSDARSKLKAGINMNINEQNLELDPIRFIGMGHSGTPGSTGDTNDMFDTRLKQNIAWSCYWQPKTLEEIARAVGVPQVYVADDLAKLVEYGYIDRTDNSKNPKFRTNMMITDHRAAVDLEPLFEKAADILCEEFFPDVFGEFEADSEHWGLSCHDNDLNFLKYNVVMAAIDTLRFSEVEWQDLSVERPDGGKFIAFAGVTDDSAPEEKPFPYWVCGIMTRSGEDMCGVVPTTEIPFASVSVDCKYSDRRGGWMDNMSSDWAALVRYIYGGRDALSAEEYKRLCDKGYLHGENVIPAILKTDLDSVNQSLQRTADKHITVPDKIKEYAKQLDAERFKMLNPYYPEHIHTLLRQQCSASLSNPTLIPRTVEKLLEKGLLQPLTDIQRKAVFSVLCLKK